MHTQTQSGLVVLPTGRKRNSEEAGNLLFPALQARERKVLLTLTILAWMMTVLSAFLFYAAVRNDWIVADWLAGLLLGMIVLDWVVTINYFSVLNRHVGPTLKRGESDK
jgi:hypothetical protein